MQHPCGPLNLKSYSEMAGMFPILQDDKKSENFTNNRRRYTVILIRTKISELLTGGKPHASCRKRHHRRITRQYK